MILDGNTVSLPNYFATFFETHVVVDGTQTSRGKRQVQVSTQVKNPLLVVAIEIYLSGLLARRQNAWSQDGGNMRVIANGVNR